MKVTLTNLHPSLRLPRPSRPSKGWRQTILRLRRAARALAGGEKNFCAGDLGIVFLDDARMAEMNWRHLRHRGATDILTFDYGEGFAEIFISLDTASREARARHCPLADEVTLYLAHGILHLAGWDDRTPAQRRQMRKAERELLVQLRKAGREGRGRSI